MSTSDKSNSVLLRSTSSLPEKQVSSGEKMSNPVLKKPERLSVELDFIRVSHETPSTSTHPHVLFSPVHYEAGYAYPLLVWLHGNGGDERQVMRVMPTISLRNYVAIAPQGLTVIEKGEKSGTASKEKSRDDDWHSLDISSILRGGSRPRMTYDWPDTKEGFNEAERRIFECISIAGKRNNIAPNRVFIVGYGTGGTLALKLGLLYPECFAGVASLCGPLPQGIPLLGQWGTAREKLSILMTSGQSSEIFPPDAAYETLELFHTAGLATTLREYPCGQELSPQMLQDLNRWIMEKICGQ